MKHSRKTVLYNVIDKWIENIDKGKFTGVPFIDLSNAFVTVQNEILMHRLLSLGIWEKISIVSLLSQCVK